MFIVYDKNMNLKEFPHGIRPLDIFIHSIQKTRSTDSVEGTPGVINKGFTSRSRPIEVSVRLEASDTKDYRLLRDEAYSFFSDDFFYISEAYQRGKRYKVSLVDSYIPNRLNQYVASIDFMLETTELPFAESIGTTMDIHNNGIRADDELWGYGMGLIDDPDSHTYVHQSNEFSIYNAGNESVDPFYQDLKITIRDVEGVFELKNKTNGSTFKVLESINGTVRLDGPEITVNELQATRKTNKKFIQLSPGWNHFEINTNAITEFDFRFYYK